MRKLLLGMAVLTLVLTGCNESKKSRGTANARGTRSQTPNVPGGTSATLQKLNCQAQDAWGLIFDDSNNQAMWQANVELFAAASVNYEDVGTVDGSASSTTTGISFCGRICPNNAAMNEVYIGIWDSKFVSGQFDSEIAVNIMHGGTYNGLLESQTQNSSAIFRDDFGRVEFVNGSSCQNNKVCGDFYFTNNVLLGVVPPQQMSRKGQRIRLGRFSITASSFWACR